MAPKPQKINLNDPKFYDADGNYTGLRYNPNRTDLGRSPLTEEEQYRRLDHAAKHGFGNNQGLFETGEDGTRRLTNKGQAVYDRLNQFYTNPDGTYANNKSREEVNDLQRILKDKSAQGFGLDLDGGGGQWFSNAVGALTFSNRDLNPRVLLNYMNEVLPLDISAARTQAAARVTPGQQQPGYNSQLQQLTDIINRFGLREDVYGGRRSNASVMRDATTIADRVAQLQQEGITIEDINKHGLRQPGQIKNDYGLLLRGVGNRAGASDPVFTQLLTDTKGRKETAIKLKGQRDNLGIPAEAMQGLSVGQQNAVLGKAAAIRADAQSKIRKFKEYDYDKYKNNPEYLRSVDQYNNPYKYLKEDGGRLGDQSSAPVKPLTSTSQTAQSAMQTGSGVKLAQGRVAAPATPQTVPPAPEVQIPAAPLEGGMSLDDLRLDSQGLPSRQESATERKGDAQWRETERGLKLAAEQRAIGREMREINQSRLNQWSAITQARQALSQQLQDLEIERMKQDGAMTKWEREMEYDREKDERKLLIEGLTGLGLSFGNYFGQGFFQSQPRLSFSTIIGSAFCKLGQAEYKLRPASNV